MQLGNGPAGCVVVLSGDGLPAWFTDTTATITEHGTGDLWNVLAMPNSHRPACDRVLRLLNGSAVHVVACGMIAAAPPAEQPPALPFPTQSVCRSLYRRLMVLERRDRIQTKTNDFWWGSWAHSEVFA